jgi:hypothetical protein
MTVDERFGSDFEEQRRARLGRMRGERITGPVTDFATDFSHVEPEWYTDPYPVQDDLRQRCPIAHTERFGGAGCPPATTTSPPSPTTTDHFSSRRSS